MVAQIHKHKAHLPYCTYFLYDPAPGPLIGMILDSGSIPAQTPQIYACSSKHLLMYQLQTILHTLLSHNV